MPFCRRRAGLLVLACDVLLRRRIRLMQAPRISILIQGDGLPILESACTDGYFDDDVHTSCAGKVWLAIRKVIHPHGHFEFQYSPEDEQSKVNSYYGGWLRLAEAG